MPSNYSLRIRNINLVYCCRIFHCLDWAGFPPSSRRRFCYNHGESRGCTSLVRFIQRFNPLRTLGGSNLSAVQMSPAIKGQKYQFWTERRDKFINRIKSGELTSTNRSLTSGLHYHLRCETKSPEYIAPFSDYGAFLALCSAKIWNYLCRCLWTNFLQLVKVPFLVRFVDCPICRL